MRNSQATPSPLSARDRRPQRIPFRAVRTRSRTNSQLQADGRNPSKANGQPALHGWGANAKWLSTTADAEAEPCKALGQERRVLVIEARIGPV